MKQYDIRLAKVPQPPKDCTGEPVMLTDATIQERLDKVLRGMKSRGFEQLVVYGDAEHCGNFQYLMGYFTRFEESLLVLDADGTAHFVLGNENLNKASKARIPGQAVHVSLFSLPNQPNRADKPLRTLLEEAGIAPGRRIGIAGWKHFTSPVEKNEKLFDIPAFILDAIRAITGGDENLFNAGDLFLGDGGAVPLTTLTRSPITNMALHWLQTVCWMLWIFWLPVCRRPHWALSSTGRASTTAS